MTGRHREEEKEKEIKNEPENWWNLKIYKEDTKGDRNIGRQTKRERERENGRGRRMKSCLKNAKSKLND